MTCFHPLTLLSIVTELVNLACLSSADTVELVYYSRGLSPVDVVELVYPRGLSSVDVAESVTLHHWSTCCGVSLSKRSFSS